MMTFAILYFGIMLTAGMFDPMVDKVVSCCKGDPLKVLVGTAALAASSRWTGTEPLQS